MTRRLAFAVGDTAGHVNPALAIADAYRERFGDADVVFFAAAGGPATDLVARAGYVLNVVPASAIARSSVPGIAAALLRVGPTVTRAVSVLRRHGTRLVIGSGGYASGGVLIAARVLGCRVCLLEPNVELGLANRWLRRVVHRAYVSHPDTAAAFPPGIALVTGTPVKRPMPQPLPSGLPVSSSPAVRVLVTSGSRGDDFLATHVPALLGALQGMGLSFHVLHQAGAAAVGQLEAEYAARHVPATVVPVLANMTAACDWATFAIARAGAGTLAELAGHGMPALLVPLADAAADHQAANAARHAEAGAALWTREAQWVESALAGRLAALWADAPRMLAMARSARAVARPNAAADIVRDCEAAMAGRW